MSGKHTEHCGECKERVFVLLSKIFGNVKREHDLNLSANPDSYKNSPCYEDLRRIFNLLQNHRGYRNFVRAKKLDPVDFFVVNQEFIVEFDESQHFTKPRQITLENYPDTLRVGFDKQRWIELCKKMDRHDNNPKDRDEQRAWYETIRDFAPIIIGSNPQYDYLQKITNGAI